MATSIEIDSDEIILYISPEDLRAAADEIENGSRHIGTVNDLVIGESFAFHICKPLDEE